MLKTTKGDLFTIGKGLNGFNGQLLNWKKGFFSNDPGILQPWTRDLPFAPGEVRGQVALSRWATHDPSSDENKQEEHFQETAEKEKLGR